MVAKHAGASPATVPRMVNGLVECSAETRERMKDAVGGLCHKTDQLLNEEPDLAAISP